MNVTKEQFKAYEDVRRGGITNMWDVKFVSELSGLNREKIDYIMDNYDKLYEKYLED
ncbi:hypothetical protein [Anaerofustis stercorihominis]|uniref:hypothetical protein n=1 Tax=Anaerofustis stercorihominis TaxID=214853 RepID=UPI0015F2F5CE|nr:hypothetical protein [Anaerofustis stercorihominis]